MANMKKWGPSPKEYGLSADGKLVETDDPKVDKLLVAAGGYLPWEEAVKHGLVEAQADQDQEPGEDKKPVSSKPISAKGALDLRNRKPRTKVGAKKK